MIPAPGRVSGEVGPRPGAVAAAPRSCPPAAARRAPRRAGAGI